MGIGCDMIIGSELMVHLGLMVDFKHQVLQWNGYAVLTKEPSDLLGKIYKTSNEIREVVIQSAELVSKIGDTEIMVQLLTVTMQRHTLNM